LQGRAAEYVRSNAPKIYSRELIDIIFTQPYCRIQNVVDAGIAKRQTASTYLKALESLGVLKEIKVGREKLFIHPNFVRLLRATIRSARSTHRLDPRQVPMRDQIRKCDRGNSSIRTARWLDSMAPHLDPSA
jgi:hypothetical protein